MRDQPHGRRLATAMLVLGLACQSQAPEGADTKAKPAAPKPTAAPTDAGPGVRDDGSIVSAVTWFEGTLDEALAKAKAEDKLVFADVGAYWCPPCHKLDELVFTQRKVADALGKGYVAVHIDAENGDGPELAERYRVQAFPTLLVIEPTGVEKGRIVDYIEPDALLKALDRIATGENVLVERTAAVEDDPDDLTARQELAHALILAARPDDAAPHFEAVVLGDPKNMLGLHSKALYDRAMFVTQKLDHNYEGAIGQYRALQKQFPESKEATKAYRQIGRLLHRLGRSDEAIASLEAMVATDPDDVALRASYGWFSFRQNCQPAQGLRAVQAGLIKAPDNAELHYLEAELQHMVGDDAKALAAIERAAELQPKRAYYQRQVKRFRGTTKPAHVAKEHG